MAGVNSKEVVMTPDQCFNEMGKLLGFEDPEGTGYIAILEKVKEVAENNELEEDFNPLRHYMSGMTGVCNCKDVVDYIERLKGENNELKEENGVLLGRVEILNDDKWVIDHHKALKDKVVLDKDYYMELHGIKEDIEEHPEFQEEVAGFVDHAVEVACKKLKEENEKLKEEKDKYFKYLKEKDLECEELREHATALAIQSGDRRHLVAESTIIKMTGEMDKLIQQVDELITESKVRAKELET